MPRSARLALRALETTIGPWQPVCRRGAARGGARGSLGSRMDPAERGGGPQPCSGGGRGRYRAKAVQMRLPTCHFLTHFANKRKIVFNKAETSLCLGVTFVWGTLTFVKNIFSFSFSEFGVRLNCGVQEQPHLAAAAIPGAIPNHDVSATSDLRQKLLARFYLNRKSIQSLIM